MKILLTNDDGIHAEGLLALVKYLEKKHEVWIVAPDRNRSGVSHGITLAEPLKLCQLAENRFSCSGVPADCTFTAINGILNEYPDSEIRITAMRGLTSFYALENGLLVGFE